MISRSSVRELWGRAWPVPGGLSLAYVAAMAWVGDLRPEHVALAAVVVATAYWSARTKQFFLDMLPFVFVGLGYDLVRYLRPLFVTADRVLGCELQAVERTLFGVSADQSAQEWLAAHPTALADLLFAVPYAAFVYVAFLYGAYLYVVDKPRMRHFLWSFALANYISFLIWLAVPAAPPWYVHDHGCAIDSAVSPGPAGLARVDELLGIVYFHDFYSRTASVFGALPSMHNAYPLLGLFTAWRHITWKTKPLHLVYFFWMFLASLYLDHHWIVDAIAGWLTALIATQLAARMLGLRADRAMQSYSTPGQLGAATGLSRTEK
jgi:hypothetical protein